MSSNHARESTDQHGSESSSLAFSLLFLSFKTDATPLPVQLRFSIYKSLIFLKQTVHKEHFEAQFIQSESYQLSSFVRPLSKHREFEASRVCSHCARSNERWICGCRIYYFVFSSRCARIGSLCFWSDRKAERVSAESDDKASLWSWVVRGCLVCLLEVSGSGLPIWWFHISFCYQGVLGSGGCLDCGRGSLYCFENWVWRKSCYTDCFSWFLCENWSHGEGTLGAW